MYLKNKQSAAKLEIKRKFNDYPIWSRARARSGSPLRYKGEDIV